MLCPAANPYSLAGRPGSLDTQALDVSAGDIGNELEVLAHLIRRHAGREA